MYYIYQFGMLSIMEEKLAVDILNYLGLSLMNVIAFRTFPVCLYYSIYKWLVLPITYIKTDSQGLFIVYVQSFDTTILLFT